MKKGNRKARAAWNAIIMLLCMALACLPAVSACAEQAGDYTYEILEDGTAAITRYNGSDTDIIIPAETDGIEVSAIGPKAFYGQDIVSVNIPEGIDSIGEQAFARCTELRSVTIPEGTVCLGNLAFEWCAQLTSVTLPASLVQIGVNPFMYSGVTELNVSPDHPFLYCEDGVLFNRKEKTLISCLALPDRNRYDIPEGTVTVGDRAFEGCQNMYYISMPDSVTSISAHSFDCWNLTMLAISPDHPVFAVIDDVIFRREDKRLIRFPVYRPSEDNDLYEIPEGIRIIGEYAFDDCHNLKAVVIPDSVVTIEDGVFRECQRMKSLKIGNGVTAIGDNATSNCHDLQEVILPASLTSIGEEFLCDSRDATVTAPRGSYAAQYCEEKGLTCVLTDPEE